MKPLFKSHGYIDGGVIAQSITRGSNVNSIDIATLPPILRVLLVTDGTVTKTLEAYFWEPVRICGVSQEQLCLQEGNEGLTCEEGDTVLSRQVKLNGVHSGKTYGYCNSLIRLDLLPRSVADDLIAQKIGIGELLRESGVESYREIINIGREFTHSPVENSFIDYAGELITRTYRIIIDGAPVILITEKFPSRRYIQQQAYAL